MNLKDELHFTQHVEKGKMQGMTSLNTAAMVSARCRENCKKPGTTCFYCYSMFQEYAYPLMIGPGMNNSYLLTERVYSLDELPFLNLAWLRINAFGSILNEIHFINIVNLAKKNPHCLVVVWDDQWALIQKVLNDLGKPANLQLIFSVRKIDSTKKIPLPQYFDKIFRVFSKEFAEREAIKINCQRKCVDCMLCYSKNDVVEINEILRITNKNGVWEKASQFIKDRQIPAVGKLSNQQILERKGEI